MGGSDDCEGAGLEVDVVEGCNGGGVGVAEEPCMSWLTASAWDVAWQVPGAWAVDVQATWYSQDETSQYQTRLDQMSLDQMSQDQMAAWQPQVEDLLVWMVALMAEQAPQTLQLTRHDAGRTPLNPQRTRHDGGAAPRNPQLTRH